MQILSGRRTRVEQLAFSHCGRWLAAGYSGGVHVWDTSNPAAKPRHPEGPGHNYCSIFGFRPNGRLFFSDVRKQCHDYDPTLPGEHSEPRGELNWGCVLSPDTTRAAEFSSGYAKPSLLQTWRIDGDGTPTAGAKVDLSGTDVTCLAFSPDGTTLATAERTRYGPDPQLVFRAADTLQKLCEVRSVYREPTQLLYSPDGTKLLLRSGGGFACWNLAKLEKSPRKAANPGRRHFLSMAFHPGGKLLTVDNDRLVRVWDTATMKSERTIEWSIGKLHSVAFSPDGTRAAVGSGTGKVLVWDWD